MYKFLGTLVIDLGVGLVGYGVTKLSILAVDKLKELKKQGYRFTTVTDTTGDVIEVNLEDINDIVFFDNKLKYAEIV